MRVDRVVARHIQFGKTPHEACAGVATTTRQLRTRAGTAGGADRVIFNGAAGWGLG
jgi:hypothetical protein